MTRHRNLSKRLKAVEALLAALTAGPVPSVLAQRAGETREAAKARYAARYPIRPASHTRYLLVTAAKPQTPEQRAEYAERFRENQRRLVVEARRETKVLIEAASSIGTPYMVVKPAKAKANSNPWGDPNPNR